MAKAQSNDLGRMLVELSKNASDENITRLLEVLNTETNKEFIEKLNSQSNKSFLRQILKISTDYFASRDAIKKAAENGSIYEDVAKFIDSNFEDISSKNFSAKDDVLNKWVKSQSESYGLSRVVSKALESYNNYVLNRTNKFRSWTTNVMFDLGTTIPKHRLDEIIFKSAKYNFYVLENSSVKVGKINAEGKEEEVSIHSGMINSHDAEELGLSVDVKTRTENGTSNVELQVMYKGAPATDISIQFDETETIRNMVKALEEMYIVNSRVVVTNDFKSEAAYINALIIEPLETLLNSTFDEMVTGYVEALRNVKQTIRTEFSKVEKAGQAKYKNPLLYAYLSIIEDGSNPTLNDRETIGRVTTTDVVAKLFQGVGDKYISLVRPGVPIQIPLDRRFSIFRAEFSQNEVIDFLIAEYGIDKKVIWVPLDKSCILPAQFLTSWDLMKRNTNTTFTKKQTGDTESGESFTAIDSKHYNPNID